MIDNSKNNSIRFLGVSEETKKEILAEIERSAEPSTPVTIADIGSPEWKRLCSGGAVSENEPIVILYSDIAEVDPGLRDRFPYSALLDRQFPVPYILHAASMVSRLRERDSELASFEHKLKMSESRLEVLLENLPFEFWACDEEGIVRYQNGISLTRFGNHVGERFRDFQSEEILHLDREENTARATLGETILSEEEYIVQGVYRSVHEVISPVVIEGRITGTMGLSIDTTEKSIVRKQLEHQEQFQEDLIRSSPFGIMIFNYSTKAISRINDTMTLLTGYTIEDIPDGASWWEKAFPDPVYRKEMLKEYRERYMPVLFEGSRVEPHEARIRTKDGRYIWLQAHYARVGDLNVTFYSDVTDRKIAEFASEENRNQLSQFLEFLPDPAFAIDRSGTVTFWNRAMEELSECPASEILGKGNHEYARRFYGFDKPMLVDYALDPSRMDQHDYDYLQADGHVVFSEVKTILGCGKEYYLWARATPLFDAAGNAIGAIEIIRDISLRKENEQQLRESEEKFRTILETLPIGFFRTDLEGNFLEVNQEIFRIFGYPPDKAFLTGARQSPSFYQDH